MSLSFATFTLFIALTPGAAFILGIRKHPYVNTSDVFDSATQEIATLLMWLVILFLFSSLLLTYFFPAFFDDLLYAIKSMASAEVKFAHLFIVTVYIVVLYALSFFIGYHFPNVVFAGEKNENLKKLIFNLEENELMVAWVYTKQQHGSKTVMYYGRVKEVKFRGDKISSIAVLYPLKTVVDYNKYLLTKHQSKTEDLKLPRLISSSKNTKDKTLYIPEENIANVFFEKKYTVKNDNKDGSKTNTSEAI